jgi:predicted TIM-barrel fold metal-dependent hydrolase
MLNDNVPAIDAWCNPFTDLGIRQIFTENPEVMQVMGDQWGRHDNMQSHEPDEFIARMDANNIRRVCMPSLKMMRWRTREMLADIPHEHIGALVSAHPDRFVGLAGINPISGMEGVRALERAVRDHGFKGAHVHPFGFGIAINEREWWPFYAKCAELDIPIVFQVGHSAEFMPSALGRPLLLDDIALWFPELRLVGGHTGWPWCEELIALAWKHPNVFIATSGHAPRYWDPKLVRFLNARRRGIGKVMWGTDYPLIMHEESLAQIDEMDLKPEARRALLHDTAVTVFKLDEPLLEPLAAVAGEERMT